MALSSLLSGVDRGSGILCRLIRGVDLVSQVLLYLLVPGNAEVLRKWISRYIAILSLKI